MLILNKNMDYSEMKKKISEGLNDKHIILNRKSIFFLLQLIEPIVYSTMHILN